MTTFTPTQQSILEHTLAHTDGRIDWFPEKLKGGARQKVLQALVTRDVIKEVDGVWYVTDAGYAMLGVVPKASNTPPVEDDPILDAAVTALEASFAKPRTRANSKQAMVLAMLRRPEGATVAQIIEATGWQAHTVRGTLAGVLKKKLGLNVVSEKSATFDRVYRIV